MWYSLAAANPKAAVKARKNARKYRAQLAKTMPPGDVSKAKRRFRGFRVK
jgi:hypothetical protein